MHEMNNLKLLAVLFIISLSLVASHASDITLSWNANAPDEMITSYRLYEQIGTGWTKIAETPLPSESVPTTLTLPNVTNAKHVYAVAAVNAVSEGPKSDTATVSARATIVRGLRVTTVTASVTAPTAK